MSISRVVQSGGGGQIKDYCFRSGPVFGIGSLIITVLAKELLILALGRPPEEMLKKKRTLYSRKGVRDCRATETASG